MSRTSRNRGSKWKERWEREPTPMSIARAAGMKLYRCCVKCGEIGGAMKRAGTTPEGHAYYAHEVPHLSWKEWDAAYVNEDGTKGAVVRKTCSPKKAEAPDVDQEVDQVAG